MNGVRAAFTLLTRLPMGASVKTPPRSLYAWFWLVGVFYGALWWIGLQVFSMWGNVAAAVLTITVEALVSGGLHWDGWADIFDVWGARRSEVRHDSRIGSIGALFVGLAVVLLVGLWQDLARRHHLVVLVAAPFLARVALASALAVSPIDESSHLAKWLFNHCGRRWALISVVIAAGWMLGTLGPAGGEILVGAAVLDAGFIWYWTRYFDGINGDVLGGVAIFTEITVMALGVLVEGGVGHGSWWAMVSGYFT